MLTTAVFVLVDGTEIGNVANGFSACADQPYQKK